MRRITSLGRRGWQTLARLVPTAGAAVRTMLGAPDYERYRAHLRAAHPGARPLTRDEFCREHAARRYERPGGRCC